jgi:hypothetical protein
MSAAESRKRRLSGGSAAQETQPQGKKRRTDVEEEEVESTFPSSGQQQQQQRELERGPSFSQPTHAAKPHWVQLLSERATGAVCEYGPGLNADGSVQLPVIFYAVPRTSGELRVGLLLAHFPSDQDTSSTYVLFPKAPRSLATSVYNTKALGINTNHMFIPSQRYAAASQLYFRNLDTATNNQMNDAQKLVVLEQFMLSLTNDQVQSDDNEWTSQSAPSVPEPQGVFVGRDDWAAFVSQIRPELDRLPNCIAHITSAVSGSAATPLFWIPVGSSTYAVA